MARLLVAVLGSEYETKIKTALNLSEINDGRGIYRAKPHCADCGKPLKHLSKEGYDRWYYRNKTGLCQECRSKSKWIEVSCFQCDTLFKTNAKELIWRINHKGKEHSFCSKRCFGKWLATHYGFRVHPENIRPKIK